MTTMFKSFIIGAAAMLGATAANATVILSSNFDTIPLASGNYTILPTAEGWTGGPGGIEIQNNAAGSPLSASNLVELDTDGNSSMFYNLGEGTYRVTYYYSPRPGIGADSNGIELFIGQTAIDSITGNGSGNTVWQKRSFAFQTGGGDLTFRAFGNSDSLGGYLDNITIASVPEASTWVMMIAGFGMIGFATRRRRSAIAV